MEPFALSPGHKMTLDAWAKIAQTLGVILPLLGTIWGFFRKMDKRITRMEMEYKPNGGSSLRDAINRIESKINNVDVKVARLEGRFDEHTDV
jgi:hypothetical protein